MKKILYTVGYGNRKPDDFLKVLKSAGIDIVLDVRREGSKSWCGKYYQGSSMRRLIRDHGGMLYWDSLELANLHDNLGQYCVWLGSPEARNAVGRTATFVEECGESVCLLCAEKDAYKDGEVNCHRYYVAEALVEQLGDGWEVVHL